MIHEGLRPGSSAENPAATAASAAPESRRLRTLELALVVGVAFLVSTVYALYDWWAGEDQPAEDGLSLLIRLLNALLSISLLAYVLHRQGRSLRSIGLTARRSDIPWALSIAFFSWFLQEAVFSVLVNFPLPGPRSIPMDSGWLAFLVVLPAAAEEELIVRAFLMTEVAALTGSLAVAVFASVGFQTLYHLYQGTPAALVGAGGFFVSAVFYAHTRRITPVILAHALHNFWVLSRG